MPKRIIQEHHISHDPEVKVNIYKGEHMILTKIQWFCKKNVSRGFITALKVFIAQNEPRAKDLNKETVKTQEKRLGTY